MNTQKEIQVFTVDSPLKSGFGSFMPL